QQTHVVFGQRRAACRDRARKAGECESDDVGVALADDGLPNMSDVGLRPVEAVEHPRLGVDDCFVARVLIFRAVMTGQDTTTESDRIAALVEYGKQHTCSEGVALASARVHVT